MNAMPEYSVPKTKPLFKLGINVLGCQANLKLTTNSLDIKIGSFALSIPFNSFLGGSQSIPSLSKRTAIPYKDLPTVKKSPFPIFSSASKETKQGSAKSTIGKFVKKLFSSPNIQTLKNNAAKAAKDFAKKEVEKATSNNGFITKLWKKATNLPMADVVNVIAGTALNAAPGGGLVGTILKPVLGSFAKNLVGTKFALDN